MRIAPRFVVPSLIAIAGLVGCPKPEFESPGAKLAGTVRVNAALKPLLPPPAGLAGTNVNEVEPNTVFPDAFQIGEIVPDAPPIIISGSMSDGTCGAGSDCRDRMLFSVTEDASVSVTFEATGGGGSVNVFLVDGLNFNDDQSNVLGVEGFTGDPLTVSAVVKQGSTYFLNLRFLSDGAIDYKVTVNAVSGTVVGKIYVGAYLEKDGHPAAFEDDPVGTPKNPLGGALVENPTIDEEGNLVGSFKDLAIIGVKKGTKVALFAYADNDGSGASAALNFVLNRPTPADFIASELTVVEAPAEGDHKDGIALVIDSAVVDQDFDGLSDEDRTGDGIIDDNCPTQFNVGQEDTDEDGVGDACDVCPSVPDSDQTNSDGVGRGDACNQDGSTTCPTLFGYEVSSCAVDSDGDEIDDTYLACDGNVAVCKPGTGTPAKNYTGAAQKLDNCKDIFNDDQLDTDNDGDGDACDEDDDGDGDEDSADNCPAIANANQKDEDGDGAGDKCDTCADLANTDQTDSDGDGFGDACDVDDDGDDACDRGAVPGEADTCTGEDNCPTIFNPAQGDQDGDGRGDACDLCPLISDDGDESEDADNDGIGDACELCPNPGTAVTVECTDDSECVSAGGLCLESANSSTGALCATELDTSGDGEGDSCDRDADGDNVIDFSALSGEQIDNCLGLANPKPDGADDQTDADGDGFGDECDNCADAANEDQADDDQDGVGNACDRCPAVAYGALQPCELDEECNGGVCRFAEDAAGVLVGTCAFDGDADNDSTGDACDPDDDGDEVCDPCGSLAPLPRCSAFVTSSECEAESADNCPVTENPEQEDLDNDGVGDVCDDAFDDDEDGVGDDVDNCLGVANDDQADEDADGAGDACDNCADLPNDQADADADAVGDACDNCAGVENGDQANADSDGRGDACDTDADNDGVLNGEDNCPTAGNDQTDTDGDGAGDECDVCELLPNSGQEDADGDGDGDACDNCPLEENASQADTDGDQVGDSCDTCPTVANREQTDTDGDGDGNACDTDDDADGVDDDADNCPLDANTDQANTDGVNDGGDACDADIDNDGFANADDVCSALPNAETQIAGPNDASADLSNDAGAPTLVDGSGGTGELVEGDIVTVEGTVGDTDTADAFAVTPAALAGRFALVTVQGEVNVTVNGNPIAGPAFLLGTNGVQRVFAVTAAAADEPWQIVIALGGTTDADGDGEPDVCDSCALDQNAGDRDADGVDDACDACIVADDCAGLDEDNDAICDVSEDEGPATCDGFDDNCPALGNHDQADFNDDGEGDVCDDTDDDGAADADDNCPVDANDQADNADGDAFGDVCDNCPADAQEDQADADGDGDGDVCDACAVAAGSDCSGIDPDGDGVCNDPDLGAGCPDAVDNCPDTANAGQADADGNELGDACNDAEDTDGDEYADDLDNCPAVSNSQADLDGDEVGDVCDPDDDGDGWCDNALERDNGTPGCIGVDNCPTDANVDQADTDDDGAGDTCDLEGFTATTAEVEPNQTQAQATPAVLVDHMVLTGSTEVDDAGNPIGYVSVDTFKVTAAADGLMLGTLTWGNADDVDVYLVDETFRLPDSFLDGVGFVNFEGGSLASPEAFTEPVTQGQELYMVVMSFGADAAGAYDLHLVLSPDAEQDDVLAASSLGFVASGDSVSVDGEVSPPRGDVWDWTGNGDTTDDEVDVYRVTAVADGSLDVALDFAAGNDLDIVLWNGPPDPGFANFLNAEGATGAPSELATEDVVAGQTVYITVHAYDLAADATGSYQLSVSMQ